MLQYPFPCEVAAHFDHGVSAEHLQVENNVQLTRGREIPEGLFNSGTAFLEVQEPLNKPRA